MGINPMSSSPTLSLKLAAWPGTCDLSSSVISFPLCVMGIIMVFFSNANYRNKIR